MTIEEFLGKLPKDGWYLSGRQIRRHDGCCPIEYVGDLRMGEAFRSAAKLGLSTDDKFAIMYAADGTGAEGYKVLRQRLLEACGLVENG